MRAVADALTAVVPREENTYENSDYELLFSKVECFDFQKQHDAGYPISKEILIDGKSIVFFFFFFLNVKIIYE